jgi:hypothetical protein
MSTGWMTLTMTLRPAPPAEGSSGAFRLDCGGRRIEAETWEVNVRSEGRFKEVAVDFLRLVASGKVREAYRRHATPNRDESPSSGTLLCRIAGIWLMLRSVREWRGRGAA